MAKVKKETLSLEEMLELALVKEEDRPYEVPGNWVWLKLRDIVEIIMGQSPSGSDTTDDDVYTPLIGGASDMGLLYPNIKRYTIKPTKVSKLDDIIVSIRATLGRPIFSDGEYCLGRGVCSVRSNVIDKKLIRYFFLNFEDYLYEVSTGTTFAQVSKNDIENMQFPLPPLSEQQRIVAIIESLFEKLDTAKEVAQNALDSFKNRKAAILHKAFIGELTVNWREENKNNENNLLTDILKYYTESGVKKNIKNILEFQDLKLQINNIENSLWYKCSIGAIGVVLNGSTPSRQNLNFWNGDISWVSSGEVRNNIIGITKERISQVGYDNSSVKMLPVGTVLIAMIGEGKTRGKSAILNIDATINQNIAAIDVSHKKVESKFIWYWLQKQYQNNRQKGNGTGPKALNCQRVRELDFILPPLAEQKEIVRILDNLLEKEQLAKELCDVIEKIDLMKKAILARVFRGELGTNDPEEESAVELLKLVLKENI